jgi:WD40 repeat protein
LLTQHTELKQKMAEPLVISGQRLSEIQGQLETRQSQLQMEGGTLRGDEAEMLNVARDCKIVFLRLQNLQQMFLNTGDKQYIEQYKTLAAGDAQAGIRALREFATALKNENYQASAKFVSESLNGFLKSIEQSLTFSERERQLEQTLDSRGEAILKVANDQLAAADSDGVLTLWTLSNLERAPLQWRAGDAEITSLAFSPDGRWLVAGDQGGQLWAWAATAPAGAGQHWQGHTNEVSMVAFGDTPDELISVSADRSVRLWNLTESLQIPIVLSGHTAAVNSVDFAGGSLFTASTDGTLRTWLLAPEALAARACTVAGRNLDRAEWERYLPGAPCRVTCAGLPDRCHVEAP